MTTLYRYGNYTPANFTPRPADADGLSTNSVAPAQRAQVLNSTISVATQAVQTGAATHYSIQPLAPNTLLAWQMSRGQYDTPANNNWDNTNIYACTSGVRSAHTGQVN